MLTSISSFFNFETSVLLVMILVLEMVIFFVTSRRVDVLNKSLKHDSAVWLILMITCGSVLYIVGKYTLVSFIQENKDLNWNNMVAIFVMLLSGIYFILVTITEDLIFNIDSLLQWICNPSSALEETRKRKQ